MPPGPHGDHLCGWAGRQALLMMCPGSGCETFMLSCQASSSIHILYIFYQLASEPCTSHHLPQAQRGSLALAADRPIPHASADLGPGLQAPEAVLGLAIYVCGLSHSLWLPFTCQKEAPADSPYPTGDPWPAETAPLPARQMYSHICSDEGGQREHLYVPVSDGYTLGCLSL